MCWDYSPFNYSGIGGDGGASARKLFTEKLRKTAERNAHAMRPSHRQTQNCVKSNIEMRRIVIKIYSFTVFNYPDTTHTHTQTRTKREIIEWRRRRSEAGILNFLCVRDERGGGGGEDDIQQRQHGQRIFY